jgi:cell division septation protein DedD
MFIKADELYVKESGADVSKGEESTALYPFSLHIGSYRTIERAEKAISLHGQEGLDIYRVKVDLKDKGLWYRIFTGFFKDREEATRFREENGLSEAIIKNARYANLVGTYESEDKLEEKIELLRGLDYCPYVIEYTDGIFSLYVGAFYTIEGAEQLYRDLQSDNIHSQVVER